MTPLVRGLLVAALQVALVASVGAKLLYDRQALPRAWAQTAPVDPMLPIRGRYVQLNLVVQLEGDPALLDSVDAQRFARVRLAVRDGRLVGVLQSTDGEFRAGMFPATERVTPAGKLWVLDQPVAYFIPESAPDPSRLQPGQVLWAEVTVPPTGPPRPIRLEVRAAAPAAGSGM